jgi:hypothetical protein
VTNRQMRFMFDQSAPEGHHPMVQLMLAPLGMRFEPEVMDDLARWWFDMIGLRLADVEPTVLEFHRGWKDDRLVDETIREADRAAVWSEQLPPGVSLDNFTGRMAGELPPGDYRWEVRVGPQVKWDSRGGDGTPDTGGGWIGALEDREDMTTPPVDVSVLTEDQKAALRAALEEDDRGNLA